MAVRPTATWIESQIIIESISLMSDSEDWEVDIQILDWNIKETESKKKKNEK